MKKIYIVSSGTYSDYTIEGVFDSKELAEAYLDALPAYYYDDLKVEEHELNPPVRKLPDNKWGVI